MKGSYLFAGAEKSCTYNHWIKKCKCLPICHIEKLGSVGNGAIITSVVGDTQRPCCGALMSYCRHVATGRTTSSLRAGQTLQELVTH